MRWAGVLRAQLARLAQDRDGATAVVTAIGLVVALGFAALGADLGVGYADRRSAQNAADSAAFSGAVGKMGGAANVAAQARAVARTYGLVHGANGVNVIVNSPALSGAMAGAPQSVEVIVERPMARFFAGVLGVGSSTIRARAVAVAGRRGDGCVIAFNPSAVWAVNFNGSPDMKLVGCSLFANSNNSQAMLMNGSPSLSAQSVRLVGGYALNGNPSLTTADGTHTGQQPVADPYADVPVPRPQGCTHNAALVNGGTVTYSTSAASPTVFCNGLTINGNATVNFSPGVYIFDRGVFLANGAAAINAPGVTFVLTSSTGSNHATANLTGALNLNITAPTGGPTAGLAFFQDREAGAGSNVINGNASVNVRGAIYFPRQQVTYNGNSSSAGGCTHLLADKVLFNGNGSFGADCQGSGVRAIGGVPSELVE